MTIPSYCVFEKKKKTKLFLLSYLPSFLSHKNAIREFREFTNTRVRMQEFANKKNVLRESLRTQKCILRTHIFTNSRITFYIHVFVMYLYTHVFRGAPHPRYTHTHTLSLSIYTYMNLNAHTDIHHTLYLHIHTFAIHKQWNLPFVYGHFSLPLGFLPRVNNILL